MIEKMSRAELEKAFKALQKAYEELREQYNKQLINTGRHDYQIW
jgi:diadenosine tetraphosphate (Ap4A) HIT family hydrolase